MKALKREVMSECRDFSTLACNLSDGFGLSSHAV